MSKLRWLAVCLFGSLGAADPGLRTNQVASLYSGFGSVAGGTTILSLCLTYSLWEYVARPQLLLWLIALWIVTAIRGLLVWRFNKVSARTKNRRHWIVLYLIGCAASGALWGISGPLFITTDNDAVTAVHVLFLVASATGGMMAHGSLRSVAQLFLVLTLLPTICHLVLLGKDTYLLIALALFCFMCVTLMAYLRANRLILGLYSSNKENTELKRVITDNKALLAEKESALSKQMALEQESKLFREMVEGTQDLFVFLHELNANGQILYGNAAACRHLGVSRDTLLTMCMADIITDADEQDMAAALALLKAGNTAYVEYEHIVRGGEKVPLAAVMNPLRLEDKILCVSYCQDISAQKQMHAERALLEVEAQYRSLIEAFPDAITRMDLQCRIQYASPQILARFDQSQGSLIGKRAIDLPGKSGYAHNQKVYDAAMRVVRTEKPYVFEEWFVREGKRGCQEFRHVPELNSSGEMVGVIGFVRNITERAKLDEARKFIARADWSDTETFTESLVDFLGHAFLCDWVIVQTLNSVGTDIRVVNKAVFQKAGESDFLADYTLSGSLCEASIASGLCCYPESAYTYFPEDTLLSTYGIESAICLPLVGANNATLGFLTVLKKSEAIDDERSVVQVLELVSGKVAAELERERFEWADTARQQDFRALVENSTDFISRFDTEGQCIYVNPALAKMYEGTDLLRYKSDEYKKYSQDAELFATRLSEVLQTGEEAKLIYRSRDTNNNLHYSDMRITAEYDQRGNICGALVISRDVSERIQLEEELRTQATMDALTNLPNRRMFTERLQQELAKARREHEQLALFFVDLDRFKEVNDTLGHDIGDYLLQEAAKRLQSCLRDSDIVARFGGDEFVVLLTSVGQLSSLGGVAQSIIKILAEPYSLNGRVAYVSASVGIASYPADAQVASELISYADQAMYAAKQAGRNGYRFFTATMQAVADERVGLLNDLRKALVLEQLQVVFQPIVDAKTEKVVKAEALLRWTHPERGAVPPSKFIPLAEDTGLIVDIGSWVIKQSITLARHWREQAGSDQIQVSINISPRQFAVEGAVETWLEWVADAGLPTQCVSVELTESLLLDDEGGVKQKLSSLRDAGVQLALDDFGTGYSAMAYLKKFNIDYLKIDGSFIRDLENDENDCAIAETIVLMAGKLGMRSIAECVENEQQRDMLLKFGCDYLQGYLYAKPLSSADFLQLVSDDVESSS